MPLCEEKNGACALDLRWVRYRCSPVVEKQKENIYHLKNKIWRLGALEEMALPPLLLAFLPERKVLEALRPRRGPLTTHWRLAAAAFVPPKRKKKKEKGQTYQNTGCS